jgi:hypothetical protein
MTEQPSRRQVLMTATALTAAASGGATAPVRAQAQGAPRFAGIDAALRA